MTYVPFKNATDEAVALLGRQITVNLEEAKSYEEAGEFQTAENIIAVAQEINHARLYLASVEYGKLND